MTQFLKEKAENDGSAFCQKSEALSSFFPFLSFSQAFEVGFLLIKSTDIICF